MKSVPSKPATVTLSWDDGHVLDLKMAELLSRHGLAATFYIPASNPERPVMAPARIRELAQGFEIGSHTRHHRILPGLTRAQMVREIRGGRTWLEQILGQPVTAFCYPGGKVSPGAVRAARKAGVATARTTLAFRMEAPRDRLCLPTTLHAFPHPPLIHLRHGLLEGNLRGLVTFLKHRHLARDWTDLARVLFDQVLARGGVWHLWGHSWEVEDMGLWPRLSDLLGYVAGHSGVCYTANSGLADAGPGAER